jgi:hypothetical protein
MPAEKVIPIYRTAPGEFIIIQIRGSHRTYISQVVKSAPLTVKIQETGSRATLTKFTVLEKDTLDFQMDGGYRMSVISRHALLLPLVTGLASMGVEDNCIREINPVYPI